MNLKGKALLGEVVEEEVGPSNCNAGVQFPPVFHVYLAKTGLTSTTYHIGEHKSQPLCTVVQSCSLTKGKTTLHGGANADSPILATATNSGKRVDVAIPAQPESTRPSVNERLVTHSSRASFSFGSAPDREEFEWRQSCGSEIKTLDKHGGGWKLVRMQSDDQRRPGGKRGIREMGETSDGREVVAVFTAGNKMSLTKWGSFRFMGSGASGELGEGWQLMAVMTALGLWQNVEKGVLTAVAGSING